MQHLNPAPRCGGKRAAVPCPVPGFETGAQTGQGDAMATRRLPLGIQNFRELRELDCYYVDKTAYVKRLLDQGKYYFLSRPRRFGKSLFLDTLKELSTAARSCSPGCTSTSAREVRESLNGVLLRHLVQDAARQTANSMRLARLLEAHDCAGLKELFHAFYASIPYHWYPNNDIAEYEGFYASVFYSYFAALGYAIVVEESSSHGRLDMAVRAYGHVYLFEFKVAEMTPPGSALAQLQERDYAAKYRGRGEPIHLVGVEFSRATRNITAFATADA